MEFLIRVLILKLNDKLEIIVWEFINLFYRIVKLEVLDWELLRVVKNASIGDRVDRQGNRGKDLTRTGNHVPPNK